MDDLWNVMDDGEDAVPIDKFVDTIRRWKIKPTMHDMLVCMQVVRQCDHQIHATDDRITEVQTELGTLKESLRDIHKQQNALLRVCKKLEMSGKNLDAAE